MFISLSVEQRSAGDNYFIIGTILKDGVPWWKEIDIAIKHREPFTDDEITSAKNTFWRGFLKGYQMKMADLHNEAKFTVNNRDDK